MTTTVRLRPWRPPDDDPWGDILGGSPWAVPLTLLLSTRNLQLVLAVAVVVAVLTPYGTYRLAHRLAGRRNKAWTRT